MRKVSLVTNHFPFEFPESAKARQNMGVYVYDVVARFKRRDSPGLETYMKGLSTTGPQLTTGQHPGDSRMDAKKMNT